MERRLRPLYKTQERGRVGRGCGTCDNPHRCPSSINTGLQVNCLAIACIVIALVTHLQASRQFITEPHPQNKQEPRNPPPVRAQAGQLAGGARQASKFPVWLVYISLNLTLLWWWVLAGRWGGVRFTYLFAYFNGGTGD